MRTYLLSHHHEAGDCGTAWAAWRGFDSPLRHTLALSTCREGGHRLWCVVRAEDEEGALSQLPPWLASRSKVTRITQTQIP
ncbi:MAG: hypothetical protein M3198_01875 [Actinomycetota bacterium]|nr:hypothetical protein [Actinomycetota bacterium]